MSRSVPRRPGVQRGFSLVELMVALVLGLIVAGSALTLVLTNRQTFAAGENMGRVQEGARLAFEMLGRELRGAGGNPCDSSLDVYSGLKDPEANWWSDWANLTGAGVVTTTAPGLRGYGGGTAFPDAAFGTLEGQRIAGTDAIEVKAAVPVSADVAILTTDYPQLSSADVGVNSTDGIAVGDLLLICNFVNASIFRATGLASGKVQHAAGTEAWDNAAGAIPQQFTGVTDNFNSGAMLSRVHAARWYVGANGEDTDNDGTADGRSLYRAMLVNNAGTPGVAVDEIARGVTDMQVGYLVRGATSYVDAAGIDFGDGSNPVVGVRVALTLSGDDVIGPGGERLARTIASTFAIRGRAE